MSGTEEMETTSGFDGSTEENSGNGGYSFGDVTDDKMDSTAWTVCSPIILIIGTFGNVLTTIVMNRKALRSTTTSLYLTVLAISDMVLLYIGLLPLWLNQKFDTARGTIPNSGCPIFWAFLFFAVHFEAWVVVSVSLERFVAVWFPIKHKVLFTKKRAALGLSILGIIFFFETMHFYFTRDPYDCKIKDRYVYFDIFVYTWLDLILASLLPFLIMMSTSLGIIYKLRVSKFGPSSSNNTASSMTTILLTVSLTFFLLTGPICVYLIAVPIIMENGTTTHGQFAAYVHGWTAVNFLYYLNSAINFLLYFLTGKRFRKELLSLFGIRKRNSVSNMASNSNHGQVTHSSPDDL